MTTGATGTRGFGYQPARSSGYHFEVRHGSTGDITIFERFGATERPDGTRQQAQPREKARLTAHRWRLVQGAIAGDFNQRLIQAKLRPGKWLKTATPLAPHFGKELVLLAWAIDDQDPTTVPRMLANWRGLAPEERWWFYTTINATTHHAATTATKQKQYGWRAAIKIAFLEDPQDIGLESLRITAEPPPPDPPPDRIIDPGPAQGRLFAEPDTPEYQV